MKDYLFPFTIFIFFLSAIVIIKYFKIIFKILDQRKYGTIPKSQLLSVRIKRVRLKLYKNKHLIEIIKKLTLKISIFNSHSYEKNEEYALLSLFVAFTLIIVFSVFTGIRNGFLWYITLIYIAVAIGFMFLIFTTVTAFANAIFIASLPSTFKILNSRYISRGNIVKAIGASINDFDKTIRNEMIRIYDILKLNEMTRIQDVFDIIEKKYNNEYMTLMLELIWHAHYKGGESIIQNQFEDATQDILDEIENKKDLSSTSRSYIMTALFLIVALPIIREFNKSVLRDQASTYYNNISGINLQILFFLGVMFFVLLIMFIEKIEWWSEHMTKIKVNLYFSGICFTIFILVLLTNLKIGLKSNSGVSSELIKILLVTCTAFFVPDLAKKIKNKLVHSDAKREIRFLKKIFILNGSIKPVDFRRVMKSIIARSYHYKKDLELIEDVHKKSNIDNKRFYSELIDNTRDVNVKLFYEKLDQAANYDFDQAVKNISGDFITEKREYARYIRKKLEIIHVVGIVGILILLTIEMCYLLAPWMQLMNLEGYY